jgi:UDP-3-O-[3-hydroxymyristoyl] glucosamine N-acyltransferase
MISVSAQDIATAVKGRLEGNPNAEIDGAAGLEDATKTQISFFHNPKYLESLTKTQAGVILVPEKLNGVTLPAGKNLIYVNNPQWAFGFVLGILDKGRQKHPKGVHPSAIIEEGAHVDPTASIGAYVVVQSEVTIGAGSILYPNCFIGTRSRIGNNVLIYPNVVLREDTQIGDRVIIHSGTVLGSDGYGFATVEGRHLKIPQIGCVVVGDDVEIGSNVSVDRATVGETRIGDGTKVDNLVHIAHNVHIGKHCLVVAQVGVAGSAKIGDHVTMGGQVGIAGHITIGDGAIIAAQSGIMSNVEPGAVLFGSPARPLKFSMKLQALYGKLPEIYDAIKHLRKKESHESQG